MSNLPGLNDSLAVQPPRDTQFIKLHFAHLRCNCFMGTWAWCILMPCAYKLVTTLTDVIQLVHKALMIYINFIPYRSSYYVHCTPDSTMGNLLCGCSLLGSSVPFPVPNLKKYRTFEVCLHCNDHSWCSPALCACSYQCVIWIWNNELFTHEVWISCTRCGFLC